MDFKKIGFFVWALIILGACNPSDKDIAEENLTENSVAGNYGKMISEGESETLESLYDQLRTNGTFEGKVRGEISEVCLKKGCWMTLQLPDGNRMRVTFKDYGFFVPTDSEGYPVILEGVASVTTTDVATLKHYAEDAGKSQEEIDAIKEEESSISFEAVGVFIEDKFK